ncbi:MAG TPA: hypothetical protein VHT34_09165, partial [Clostridia bacterium]|nr:hypothetical protein [Clostridia bacterium]
NKEQFQSDGINSIKYTSNGTPIAAQTNNKIKVSPNTRYIFSCKKSDITVGGRLHVVFYDKSGNKLTGIDENGLTQFTANNTTTKIAVDTPSSADYATLRAVIDNADNRSYASGLSTRLYEIQLEKGTSVTSYESYKESSMYLPANTILSSLGNIKDEINISTGKIIQRTKILYNQANNQNINFSDMAASGIYTAYNSNGENKTGVKGDALSFTNGNVTVIYQLATPVIANLNLSPVTCYTQGTVYLDYAVRDTEQYGDRIAVVNTSLPIKSFESIYKMDGSTMTPVDPSKVTIAADGLAFTIAGANKGERYQYTYFYDSNLSAVPGVKFVVPTSTTDQTNDNTNMINSLLDIINNLNARLTKLEQQGSTGALPRINAGPFKVNCTSGK